MKAKKLVLPSKEVVQKKGRKNLDSPWKDALDIFFKDFIEFCFPKMAAEIDWSKGYTLLDKELHSITKDAETGQRTVVKLVKVFKKEGTEIWVLVHCEVQNKKDEDFSERMYTYQYRLFDRYRVPIVSIAVLTDNNKNWAPSVYQSSLWGTELTFKYNVLKILSYQAKQKILERSSNPFATVILAQLATMTLAKEKDMKEHFASK
jgi:hypothetical protein